jgi:hypothetical protein
MQTAQLKILLTLILTPLFIPLSVYAEPVINGDLRYRFLTETVGTNKQQNSQQLMARLGVGAEVTENLKANFRISTGTKAVSSNQTLGDRNAPGMPKRTIGLDQAFADYEAIGDLHLLLGKQPGPFYFAGKNQMLFDRDISFEGFAAKYFVKFENEHELAMNGATFKIRENYDSTNGNEQTDNDINGGQILYTLKQGFYSVMFGFGQYEFVGIKNTAPSDLVSGATTATAGNNTFDSSGNYPTEFVISQKMFELKFKPEDYEIGLFYEMNENTKALSYSVATSYGLVFNIDKWGLHFSQQEIEKDSVVGLFTDADFAKGNTSAKGYVASVSYKLSAKSYVALSVFDQKTNIDAQSTGDYKRNHLDFGANF